MDYSKSALEQEMMHKGTESVGWPWRLLLSSFFIFVAVSGLYLGLNFGYKGIYLKSQVNAADSNLRRLELNDSEKNDLIIFYSRINNIGEVLASRHLATKYAELLEKNTLKQITYEALSMGFSGKKFEARIVGFAPSYNVISQQMEWFGKMAEVKGVSLDSSTTNSQTGLVNFTMRLTF